MPEAQSKVRGKKKQRAAVKAAAAPEKKRGTTWWIYVLAGAAVFFVAFQIYAPALRGPFLFDDSALPYHSFNFSDSVRAWLSGVRPLLMFSYWINYRLSQEPTGFHVTNIVIHILNSFLIFLIVLKLQRISASQEPGSPARPLPPSSAPQLLAGFAAAIFLLHPIQTESVSYIAGRSETLSVLFLLSAFAVFLYRRAVAISWPVSIAVLVLFGAALASKEHTLVLPALLLLTDYYWNPGFSLKGIRHNWRLYAPIAAGAVAGLVFVARILASAGGSAGFGIKEFTWYQYFFTECRAFFVYLRLLVFPAGQSLDWDYPISRSVFDHGAILALLAILALAAAAIYFRRRYPLASYGFFAYVLLMAPTSSFVPIKDPIAERRLYLPMIGMLLVAVAALEYVRLDRRKLAGAMAAVIAVLAVATYQRNELWASDIAIWEDAAAKSPGKQRVHFQLAHTYFTHNRCQDAVNEYAAGARVEKPDYGLLVDWGLAYDCLNQTDEALAKLREAAALDSTAHVYTQIAMVYAKQSRWPEALAALAQAEKIDPSYDMIYDNRGGIRARTNDPAGAAAEYRHALALNPLNEHARQMLEIVQRPSGAPR